MNREGWNEFSSCSPYLFFDIMVSVAAAWRLFSLGGRLATIAGICVLISGIGMPALAVSFVSKWRAANPENPAPVGKALCRGLNALALTLLFVLIFIK